MQDGVKKNTLLFPVHPLYEDDISRPIFQWSDRDLWKAVGSSPVLTKVLDSWKISGLDESEALKALRVELELCRQDQWRVIQPQMWKGFGQSVRAKAAVRGLYHSWTDLLSIAQQELL